MKAIILRFFLIIFFACAFSARNQGVQIEDLKAEILLKLLSQNRSIDFAGIDSVRLAVLFDGADSRSRGAAETYRDLFERFPNPPFKDRPLQVNTCSNAGLDSLAWDRLHAVVIMPGRDNRLAELLQSCADFRVLSMTTDTTLARQGVSVAVEIDPRLQPVICFNLNSLEREGAVYDAKILELARRLIWE